MIYEKSSWMGIIILIIIIFIVIMIIIIYIARNQPIPICAGTVDSGIVSIKRLRHFQPAENDHKLVAAIVEPRTNNLVETIQHYLNVLPSYTHFQIYHGTKNKECLKHFEPLIREGKIELFDLGVENLTIMGYCKILCSVEFWNSLRSEKVLIFQTDSITCRKSNYDIEEFLDYDYVGAPLPVHVNLGLRFLFLLRGWNIKCDFYNGGLSLRDKSLSIRVIEKYPWDEKTPEDVWFCAFMDRLGGKLCDYETAKRFSYEAISNFDVVPWGLHKPRKNKDLLERYCPEHHNIPFVKAYTDYKTLYMV